MYNLYFYITDQTAAEEKNQSNQTPASSVPQSDAVNAAESNKIVVVDHAFQSQVSSMSHFQWFVSSSDSEESKLNCSFFPSEIS